jgi:hypothetical protein
MNAQDQLKKRRDEVINELSDAFADDALELAEFERRLAEAHKAEEVSALDATVRDLPKRAMGPDTAPATSLATVEKPRPVPAVVQAAPKTVRALLGSVSRGGAWALPHQLTVRALLGSCELDLREAVLSPGVTEIEVSAVFGSIEITVPPNLAVEVDGTAVLGSFEHLERAPARPDPDTPILRIKGKAVLGSVDVMTKVKARG